MKRFCAGLAAALLWSPLLWSLGAAAQETVHFPSLEDNGPGQHRGYARLPDPVTHRRTWRFDPAVGRLSVQDEVDCRGAHQAARFLTGFGEPVVRLDH